MEVKLNLRQAAALMNMPLRTARYKAQTGQLPAECILNTLNRPEYVLSLSALPPDAQSRWYAQNGERFERVHLGHIDGGAEIFRSMGDADVTFELLQ